MNPGETIDVQFFAAETPLPRELLGMTFPFLHPRLVTHDPRVAAVVLLAGKEHAGLALGSMGGSGGAEILSLGIVEAQRRRGLGTVLLQALEQLLASRGARKVRIAWDSALPSAPALERVLQKRRWMAPRREMQFAQITGDMAASPWVERAIGKLPAAFTLFPWAELSVLEAMALRESQAEVPAEFRPFDESESAPVDPHTSVGLRVDNEVGGWVITHRVAPDSVRYTSLFVRDRWRTPLITFALLAEAMRRCPAAHGPSMRGALAVRVENEPMMKLLERKFRPFAVAWHEQRVAEKMAT